jgi:hypothetical protein
LDSNTSCKLINFEWLPAEQKYFAIVFQGINHLTKSNTTLMKKSVVLMGLLSLAVFAYGQTMSASTTTASMSFLETFTI